MIMSSIKTDEVDASSLLPPSGDGEVVCYLCLDTGANEQLRRDCACRATDAGFVHLACLNEYAASTSMQAHDMNEFVDPWHICPSCHRYYQNELGIDIATKFVSFVRGQYPHDTQRQVEALYLKLFALIDMIDRLQPVQKTEAGVTANVLLSLIDRMRANVSPLPKRYSEFETEAYNVHGEIALDEGTDESARRAVAHFEKNLKVLETIGDDEGIAIANRNIAIAKSKYVGGNNNEELLNASRELYELRAAKFGEEHEYTIDAGRNYALELYDANRGVEARELLTKLLVSSKQVFGPDHNITKVIVSALKSFNTSA